MSPRRNVVWPMPPHRAPRHLPRESDMALALLCGCRSSIRQGVMTESRRFVGRRGEPKVKLPPGQYLTTDFPVLSAGPTPHVPLDKWELTIDDGTNVLRRWSWTSFRECETDSISADLHCVTRWSKLDTMWEGVSLDALLA